MMSRKPPGGAGTFGRSGRRSGVSAGQASSDPQAEQSRLDDEFETVVPRGMRESAGHALSQGGPANTSTDASPDQEASAPASDAPARRGPASREPARKGLSLKARAVGYLSRREHARSELARKLRPYAEDLDEIEAVLDVLQREGWLSNERFAQSLVHRRAPRHGTARVVQELRQHGLDDAQVAELREQLRATEYERAQAAWRKRFGGERPVDRADYARQARFLAGRGFAHDVIRRILGESDDD